MAPSGLDSDIVSTLCGRTNLGYRDWLDLQRHIVQTSVSSSAAGAVGNCNA